METVNTLNVLEVVNKTVQTDKSKFMKFKNNRGRNKKHEGMIDVWY